MGRHWGIPCPRYTPPPHPNKAPSQPHQRDTIHVPHIIALLCPPPAPHPVAVHSRKGPRALRPTNWGSTGSRMVSSWGWRRRPERGAPPAAVARQWVALQEMVARRVLWRGRVYRRGAPWRRTWRPARVLWGENHRTHKHISRCLQPGRVITMQRCHQPRQFSFKSKMQECACSGDAGRTRRKAQLLVSHHFSNSQRVPCRGP